MRIKTYLLMDAILIILSANGDLSLDRLQYSLLQCGILVQMPVLMKAIEYMKKEGAIHGQKSINLGNAKLMDHSSIEFIEFIDDCKEDIALTGKPWEGYRLHPSSPPEKDFFAFEFDKKQMYQRFIGQNSDFNVWLKFNKFNKWLAMYSELGLGIKNPKEWRSDGISFIQFTHKKR